jgi:GMP synthase PP-ATPase subunit
MNDKEKHVMRVKEFRKQISQSQFRDSLRTRFTAVDNDEQFEELLRRLEDAETARRNIK